MLGFIIVDEVDLQGSGLHDSVVMGSSRLLSRCGLSGDKEERC